MDVRGLGPLSSLAMRCVSVPFCHKRKLGIHGCRSATRYRVTARKEIILSAGSFNSPQLLMLSGIGDKAALSKVGISTIVNIPSVGKNMSDHVLLANPWSVNSNDTFSDHLSATTIGPEIQKWTATHKGPLSYTITNQLAWLRLPKNDTIFKTYRDPTPGPTSAHHELIFTVRKIST